MMVLDFTNCTIYGIIFDKSNLRARFTNCNFSEYLFSARLQQRRLPRSFNIGWTRKITTHELIACGLAYERGGMSIVDLCGRSVTTVYNKNIQEFRTMRFLGGTV